MSNRTLFKAATSVSVMASGLFFAVPVAAADVSAPEITAAEVSATLPGTERAKWDELSPAQQERTVEILNDPEFMTPQFDLAQNPEVETEVVESEAATTRSSRESAEIAPMAAGTLKRSIAQEWTVFRVTYTRISTNMTLTTNGVKVVRVDNCWNDHTNYVPMRTVTGSSYSGLTGASAPSGYCKTDWALGRPGQSTTYGTQGILVNGSGTIVTRWKVPQ